MHIYIYAQQDVYIYIYIYYNHSMIMYLYACINIIIHSQVASYLDMPAPEMVGCFNNQIVLTS